MARSSAGTTSASMRAPAFASAVGSSRGERARRGSVSRGAIGDRGGNRERSPRLSRARSLPVGRRADCEVARSLAANPYRRLGRRGTRARGHDRRRRPPRQDGSHERRSRVRRPRSGRRHVLLVVAGDFGESAPVAVPGEAGATVRFSRLLASLEGCPTRLPVGPLDLRACLRVEGGERTTAGEGLPNPQSVTRPWFALGVTAHIRAYLFRSLFADLGGLVLLPIVRDDVYARPSTPVQNVPWVGGGGELGHGVEFR
jgi:hypothetical protein